MVGGPIVTAGGLTFIAATMDSTLVGTVLTDHLIAYALPE
jgi:glucose dehydrogenase